MPSFHAAGRSADSAPSTSATSSWNRRMTWRDVRRLVGLDADQRRAHDVDALCAGTRRVRDLQRRQRLLGAREPVAQNSRVTPTWFSHPALRLVDAVRDAGVEASCDARCADLLLVRAVADLVEHREIPPRSASSPARGDALVGPTHRERVGRGRRTATRRRRSRSARHLEADLALPGACAKRAQRQRDGTLGDRCAISGTGGRTQRRRRPRARLSVVAPAHGLEHRVVRWRRPGSRRRPRGASVDLALEVRAERGEVRRLARGRPDRQRGGGRARHL